MKYGNGTETRYTYSPNRRRLATLSVTSPAYEGEIMSNVYRYDEMDNITSLVNDVTAKAIGNAGRTIGGRTSHSYDYDRWSRLIGAEGSFRASDTDTAHYNLSMSYDKLYNVTSKKLDLIQENLQFKGRLESGHEFTYTYDEENTFKLLNVNAKEYSSDSAVTDTFRSVHLYDFDANGNQILAAVNPTDDSMCVSDTAGQKVRQMLWDEENRLLAINDNGFVSNYFYDASGERTVKLSAPDLAVYVNSEKAIENDSALMKFVGYVSPYLVVTNGGRYTKHIYAGSQRIASKMGDIDAFGADPRRVEYAGAGIREIDFADKYGEQNGALAARYDSFNVENRPKENNDYVNGKSFCCGGTPLSELSDGNTGEGESADYEGDIRLYHVDHLGSTSLVTDIDGEITQHVAYIPYGEIFVEQRNGSWNTPYLFNAKELDEETGLYYYGARYLDPTNATWLSVDPLFEKYVGMTPYNYCAGNPVIYSDPTGCFKVSITEDEMNTYGLSKENISRFYTLVENIGNLIDQEVLSVIINTTGLSETDIKEDMVYGKGPTINLTTGGSYCDGDDIYINWQVVKDLTDASSEKRIRGKDYSELAEKCFLTSLTILHEYGHYGDQKTNKTNSGQWTMIEGVKKINLDKGWCSKAAKAKGSQKWQESKTGHRGDDVTYYGFGAILNEGSRHNLEIDSSDGRYDPMKIGKLLNATGRDMMGPKLNTSPILKKLKIK